MSNLKQLKIQLEASESLKLITESLSEVAAIRFKGIRSQILHNRIFFSEVNKVYHSLKVISARRKLLTKQPIQKNSRTISILITSNYQLYGGIDAEVTEYFLRSIPTYQTEKLIIGSTGIDLYSILGKDKDFKRAVFKQDLPTQPEIQTIVDQINNYSRILLYYPRFVTILQQVPQVFDFTQSQAETEALTTDIEYILEPELSKMLEFFEKQILGASLQSIFLQTQLSRTAARMIRMDQAEIKAEGIIKKEKLDLTRTRKKLQNLHILENFPVTSFIDE